jgi:hypothetical protein
MQSLVAFWVIGLLLYAVVRLIATAVKNLGAGRYKAYHALATRYRGRYESRGLYEPPTVSFGHNGSHVRVGLAPVVAGQPTAPRTRVVARFARGLPFRLELAPVARPAPAQSPKGTRPVRIGDQAFDRVFVVHANDAEIARAFLGPVVRQAVENLRRLSPPGGMLLSVNPERLLVQVDRNLGQQPEILASVVDMALSIHDCLQTSVTARLGQGITVVGVGPAAPEDAGPAVCKVCGDPIPEVHVICVSCQTPHHRDCWTFIGGCSIYGCHGKQFQAVPAPTASHP